MTAMKASARAVAILTSTVALLVALAAPALADSPDTAGWDPGEGRSALENLVFFGGATVGLFVAITLFAILTARHNYVPPPPGTDVEVSSGH